ncbi:MAG TPA: hypothetical protein VNC11_03370, partial [Gemmatimonadaceae bacterium]|nr:hypothetical protein [Gemmatimonadaceae bacterium]
QNFDVADLVFMPTIAPLPMMLGNKTHKPGTAMVVGMVDPLSRTVKKVRIRIHKDSLFTVTDSAALDSASGRWVTAHQDTVRGWLISGDVPTVVAWVDESGRMIAASEPGGMSVMRTAFEMAFENWRLDQLAADSAAKAGRRTTTGKRK